MTKIINLTPHAVTLRTEEKETTFPTSGTIARVEQETIAIGKSVGGFPIFTSKLGGVVMPKEEEDTFYIVSAMVLSALKGTRSDVIAPRTDSTAIRNEKGHIVAVRGWLQ